MFVPVSKGYLRVCIDCIIVTTYIAQTLKLCNPQARIGIHSCQIVFIEIVDVDSAHFYGLTSNCHLRIFQPQMVTSINSSIRCCPSCRSSHAHGVTEANIVISCNFCHNLTLLCRFGFCWFRWILTHSWNYRCVLCTCSVGGDISGPEASLTLRKCFFTKIND